MQSRAMPAASFNQFGSNGFGPRQSIDLDPNILEFNLQQHISEQQALSPRARPDGFFSPTSMMPQSTSSAVNHQYGHTVSDVDASFTYATLGMALGDSSGHHANGGSGSNEPVAFQNPASRHSSGSFGRQHAPFLHHQQQPLPNFSAAQATATIQPPRVSPPLLSPPAPTPQPNRRRRAAQRPRAQRDDSIIGLVLLDKKKFKCANTGCEDLTFGRLADLRRHHDQQHAKVRHQYFCSFAGCPRSNAVTGGKGRSFGTRKDKKDEHERNVHKKQPEDNREMSYSPQDESF